MRFFLIAICVSAVNCLVVQTTENHQVNGTNPRHVFAVEELQELGRHPETVCPFTVEERTVEREHRMGIVSFAVNEILCKSCQSDNCSGKGRSCNQLLTNLRVFIRNPETGQPENVISAEVAVGCSCAPQDGGIPSEDIP